MMMEILIIFGKIAKSNHIMNNKEWIYTLKKEVSKFKIFAFLNVDIK